MLNGTYFLRSGNLPNQQTVSTLFNRHGDGSLTDVVNTSIGDITSADGTLSVKAVLINPSPTGISFADFEGGLEDLADDIWDTASSRGYVEGGVGPDGTTGTGDGGVVIGRTFAR